METKSGSESLAEVTVGASAIATGLGVLTFALFPLLLPGVIVTLIFTAPLLLPAIPIAIIALVLWPLWRLGRRAAGALRPQAHRERSLSASG